MLARLKLKPLWYIATALVTAAALYELLRPPGPDTGHDPLAFVKHFIGFFLLSFWYFGLFKRDMWTVVTAWLLFIAVGSEFAQSAMGLGRMPDWKDGTLNLLGLGVAMVLAMTGLGRWPLWIERWIPGVPRD